MTQARPHCTVLSGPGPWLSHQQAPPPVAEQRYLRWLFFQEIVWNTVDTTKSPHSPRP